MRVYLCMKLSKMKVLFSILVSGICFTNAKASNGVVDSTNVITHNILSDQLPATLLTDIRKDYKDYWISDLYEETDNKKPSYHITLENADQIVKLSSDDSKRWVVVNTVARGI
jgi:hypothetical protein